MRKLWISLLIIISVVGMTILIPDIADSIKADDATYTDIDKDPGTGTPTSTTGNSLTVLEIVPYKGMSEIGYLVGGEEPIDEELFHKDTAAGALSFLGEAITVYDAIAIKDLPTSGTADSGWTKTMHYASQNGYFQYIGQGTGSYEKLNNQTVFKRVPTGTGNYNAKLDTESTSIYIDNASNQTNYKNVNAYFVCGTSTGVPLYSTTNKYTPVSVKRNTEGKGNYDYNTDTASFELKKGQGKYDVLFARTYYATKYYYMTNDYEIVDDCSGEYSWTLSYYAAAGGNYKSSTETTFVYRQYGGGNCNYNWVENSGALSKTNFTVEGTPGTTTEKVWVQNQKVIIWKQFDFNVTLINNEWFKRLSLGLTNAQCDEVDVDVVTLTPRELNMESNQHYLKEADIVYINDRFSHNGSYITLYETYSHEGRALSPSEKFASLNAAKKLNFGYNDLSWKSTMMLYNRIAGVRADGSLGGYRAAVVFDNTYYQNAVNGSGDYSAYHANVTVSFNYNSNGASVSNLAKLYIMVYQRDAAEFYKLFLSPTAPMHITEVSSSKNSTGTTGSFVRPDSSASSTSNEATYWNGNTFCPYCFNDEGNVITPTYWIPAEAAILSKKIPNFNITAQTTDMISNVLTLNGMDIFTEKFVQPLYGMPADAVEAAQIYLNSLGLTTTSTLNLFSYIRVTSEGGTGYGSGKDDATGEDGAAGSNLRTYISILNIEPTADFSASEINIRKMMEGKNIRITNMTSAEFNSSIIDINTYYDLIYMGDSSGRFNQGSVPGLGITTKFNKSALNGSVYHTGDTVNTDSGTKIGSGNDITTQKTAELKDFLDAGYPIVLDNDLYTVSSVIRSDTNLYSFLRNAVNDTDYRDNLLNYNNYGSNYQTFMTRLTKALNIKRPQIRMIRPETVSGSGVNYVYVDEEDKFSIEFAVVPNGLTADRSIYYSAYLYLDFNEDGIFSPNEMLNEIPTGLSSPKGFNESFFKSHLYTYSMADYNGVYQWKVKVVKQYRNPSGDLQDTPIRSEITGYAAVSHKQPIRVLQIIDNPSDLSAYSLENAANNNSSLIKTYIRSDKLTDYDVTFDTMTVNEFLRLYETKPYTTATASTTNKLGKYHLLIVDNQVNSIVDTYGALKNIQDEIKKKMGVIFTKGSINYSNQNLYLDKPIFVDKRTYGYLSYHGTPSTSYPYYLYDFNGGFTSAQLKAYSTYQTMKITKTNEGADSQYPYLIGDSINVADASFLEDATIDYSLDVSNIGTNPPLVGWYSLSDSLASTHKGIYSTSPNDAKNNYYLFNRGTVYFSGIQLNKADTLHNDDEIKLFINTIIATYKSSNRLVVTMGVTIDNDDLIKNVDKSEQYLYIDIDYIPDMEETSYVGETGNIRLEFSVTGIKNSDLVSIKVNDASDNPISVVGSKLYKVSDSTAYNLNTKEVPKGSYYVDIPASVMTNISSFDVTITASLADDVQGASTVTLLRRSLFQLD